MSMSLISIMGLYPSLRISWIGIDMLQVYTILVLDRSLLRQRHNSLSNTHRILWV